MFTEVFWRLVIGVIGVGTGVGVGVLVTLVFRRHEPCAVCAYRDEQDASLRGGYADTIRAYAGQIVHLQVQNERLEKSLIEALSPGVLRRVEPPEKPTPMPSADDDEPEEGVEMPPL